jgi:hypothetical protein
MYSRYRLEGLTHEVHEPQHYILSRFIYISQHTYLIPVNICAKAYQILKILFTNTASKWKYITNTWDEQSENW